MIHKLADVQSKNIGENTNIWQYCVVLSGAKIGSGCNICSHCFIENEVVIGDNVWIGDNVTVLPNVHIGKGCVIGANSVVTKDIPDNCIAVGIPAKVIKKFDYKEKKWVRVL